MSKHRANADLANSVLLVKDPGDGEALEVRHNLQQQNIDIGSGSETNTLADPKQAGLILTIVATSDAGGSRAITAASAIDISGNTIMTFDTVRDIITLSSIVDPGGTADSFKWQIVANSNVALS